MAIQDFTAGQVLTALQMDNLQANDYNQTVSTKTASYTLVATDKGTRVVMNSASATTITVNTSLFSAGDTLVLQNIGAGICTVTAGTATVSTAGSLAIPQNGSGTLYFTSAGVSIFYPSAAASSGLTLVTTSTFTASASHSVNNCFSATYANYLVQVSKIIANNSTPREIQFRLRVGGVDNTTASSYQTQRLGAHTTSTNYAELLQQNYMFIEQISDATQMNATINLTNPFTADKTGLDVKANGYRTTLNFITVYGLGEHSQTVSYDGFTIFPLSGTISGTVRVYGYTN